MYTVYVLVDKRAPRKPVYTGVTGQTLEKRHARRLTAAKGGNRPELVNRWINEIGPSNVVARSIATCSNRKDAELLEQHNIATKTHVSLGGKNRRRK